MTIMHIEPLGLQHQQLLIPKFEALKLSISEYNFPNLFLFRSTHNFEVLFAEHIYIKGRTRNGEVYYMPTEPPLARDYDLLQKTIGEPITFFPIPEQWLNRFPCPQFSHESLSQDTDYLYATEQMKTYSGNSLSGQRNQVKQFKTKYCVRVVPLNSETRDEAIAILEHWRKNDQETDFNACMEAIHLHETLNLSGLVFEVNKMPGALIIGSQLTSEIYLVQFAKADTQFKGIYQFAYQHMAQSLENRFHLINMEQDLGVPGLHKTKLSYHPAKLEAKWRIKARTF